MANERLDCEHWDSDKGTCTFNKDLVTDFLKSVKKISENGHIKASVDPRKDWSQEDWQRYLNLRSILASDAVLNLSSGRIDCGEGCSGVNQFCDQWKCEGRKILEKEQRKHPNTFVEVTEG
jgi:hypothetical protein